MKLHPVATRRSRPLTWAVLVTLFGCAKVNNLPPPEVDHERREALGILCSATVKLDGQFALGAPKPDDISGCWPVGTWTIAAEPTNSDCASLDGLEREYRFRVTRDEDESEQYEYLNNPSDPNVQIKVTSGGAGLCEGNLVWFSGDGKRRVNLVVFLNAGRGLDGSGEYEVYREDQR